MNKEVGCAKIAQRVKIAFQPLLSSIRVNWEFAINCDLNMLLKKNSTEFMYDLSSGVLFLLCKNGLHHIKINFLPMKAKKYFEYVVMQKKSNISSQSPPFFMKRQK